MKSVQAGQYQIFEMQSIEQRLFSLTLNILSTINVSGHATHGATHGVTVSMSAFLACHQCYCAGSSLAWGLNVRAVVCDIF